MRSSCSCSIPINTCIKMISTNFFASIFLCCIPYVLSLEELSCNLHNHHSYDGIISVVYDREELSIYTYKNTQYVNFLLYDVQIIFKGNFTNKKNTKINIGLNNGLKSDVEGIAKLDRNEEESWLTACQLDLRKNAKFADNIFIPFQEKFIELAHTCIKPKLCKSLSSLQSDDYLRAKIGHHDFGENSVMSLVFAEKYPSVNLPSPTDNNLQHTINLLVDFSLASFITQISKEYSDRIKLPDVSEEIPGIPMINKGYFKLVGGTFGNLRNITRFNDITVSHKGLAFTVEAEYGLPEAHIHFNKYALKIGLISSNGNIDIKIEKVSFYVKITVNYNRNPCEITISGMKSKIGAIAFTLSDTTIFDSIINTVTNKTVNNCISNIISLLETKLKTFIDETLNNLDCEKFRP